MEGTFQDRNCFTSQSFHMFEGIWFYFGLINFCNFPYNKRSETYKVQFVVKNCTCI